MKNILFYLNIISQIKTFLVAKEILKLSYESVGLFDYYRLVDSKNHKIDNPTITSSKIVLLLPIAEDIRQEKTIDIYVNDQKQIIDALIYEAGVGSMFYVSFENKFTEDDESLVVVVTWELKHKHLLISISIYVLTLILLGCLFVIYK